MEKAWKDSRQVPLIGLQGWPQRLPCKIRGTVGSAKHLLRLRARQQGLHEGRAGCVLSLSVQEHLDKALCLKGERPRVH